MSMTDNITDIRSKIDLLADRIAWIDRRRQEIRQMMTELTAESNELHAERAKIDAAGKTLHELAEKPQWRK
jgi:hypothetical protein